MIKEAPQIKRVTARRLNEVVDDFNQRFADSKIYRGAAGPALELQIPEDIAASHYATLRLRAKYTHGSFVADVEERKGSKYLVIKHKWGFN